MQMPQNLEMERVIHLTKNAVEQLERQNPLSSLHGTQSRAMLTVLKSEIKPSIPAAFITFNHKT
jgi:hypothetical protein